MKRFILSLLALVAVAVPALGGDLINPLFKDGANRGCGTETTCFAIDATTAGGTVSVRDTTTPANNLSNVPLNGFTFSDTTLAAITGSNVGQSATTPKDVYWPTSPYVRSAPHNLGLQTQTIDNAQWTNTRSTVTANATTAPDGTSTAEKLVEDNTAGNSHFTSSNIAPVVGITYNVSVYAKTAGQSRYLGLGGGGTAGAVEVPICNLDAGTVDVAGTTTVVRSATITSVGSGWYRCSMVITASATTTFQLVVNNDSTTNNLISYNGDNTSGFYVWGFQVTQGPYLHPYHANVASAWYGVPQGYDIASSKYGILSEPAATNLALRSEQIDNASWTKTSETITADNTASPDSAVTADLVTTTGSDLLAQAITLTASTDYVASLFIKPSANIQWIRVQVSDGANSFQGWFDILNGVKGSTAVSGAGTTAYSNSMLSVGGGWYRIVMSGKTSSSTSQNFQIVTANADASGTRASSGATFFVWGTQLEAGKTIASSYTPTGTASVTRNADDIRVTLTTIPWSDTNGTIYQDFFPLEVTVGDRLLGEFAKDANNSVQWGTSNGSGQIYGRTEVATAVNYGGGTLTPGNATANARNQLSFAFANNDYDMSLNASAATSSGTMAVTTGYTTFYLGHNIADVTLNINMFTYRFIYVPRQVETAVGNLENWRYNY